MLDRTHHADRELAPGLEVSLSCGILIDDRGTVAACPMAFYGRDTEY